MIPQRLKDLLDNLVMASCLYQRDAQYGDVVAALNKGGKVWELRLAIEKEFEALPPPQRRNDPGTSYVEVRYEPSKKIPVIKAIREATGWGLLEAKLAADAFRVSGLTRAEAYYVKHCILQEAPNATVTEYMGR